MTTTLFLNGLIVILTMAAVLVMSIVCLVRSRGTGGVFAACAGFVLLAGTAVSTITTIMAAHSVIALVSTVVATIVMSVLLAVGLLTNRGAAA